ncbi:hypothetical protein QFZ76_009882 [Streptomyces sp. V4I2]|nr:hypothetical protein [Streptomyces sp. V4I2]
MRAATTLSGMQLAGIEGAFGVRAGPGRTAGERPEPDRAVTGPAVLLRPRSMYAADVRRAGRPAQRAVPPLQPRTEAVAARGRRRARWSSRSTAVPTAAAEVGPDPAAGPAHGAGRPRTGAARPGRRRLRVPEGEAVRHAAGRRRIRPRRRRPARPRVRHLRCLAHYASRRGDHLQGPCHCLQQGHQGGRSGRLGGRRSLAPAAKPRRGRGEDLPPTPLLPAETRRGGDRGVGDGDRHDHRVTDRRTAPHPDHRADPAASRRRPPTSECRLDHQRHRPPPPPGPQDRAPLPRHQPRHPPRLRPRPTPHRRPRAVQGIRHRPLHRHRRQHHRTPGPHRDPSPGLPRQRPGHPQTLRRPPRRHRRTRPRRHPQPPEDHLVDHVPPGRPPSEGRRTTPPSPARLPGHHPRLRPAPHLPRPGHPPPRAPANGLDPPGRTGRSRTCPWLRRLPPPGPRSRHRRPHPGMELRRRRGQREQSENDQEEHVQPGILPAPPDPHPHPTMRFTKLRPEP